MLTLMRTRNDFFKKAGFNTCVVHAGSQSNLPGDRQGWDYSDFHHQIYAGSNSVF